MNLENYNKATKLINEISYFKSIIKDLKKNSEYQDLKINYQLLDNKELFDNHKQEIIKELENKLNKLELEFNEL